MMPARTGKRYGLTLNLLRSFTILELTIVLSITAIFIGMSFVYYGQYNEFKKLESDSTKLAGTLDLARKKTAANDISTSCSSGVFSGYRVVVNSSNYQLKARCSGGTDVTVTDYSFSSSTNISPTATVDFKQFALGATPACLVLSSPNTPFARCISVLQSGIINEGVYQGQTPCTTCP